MIKKYKDYLIMLIIITIIGISIFLANNTYPFGYNYLLSDSIYKAHLLEVINNIDLYHNISYSFNYALGYNLFYVFTILFVSPFTILELLFKNNLNEVITISIFFKMILSSFTFYIYIRKKDNKVSNIITTIIYGVSSLLCPFVFRTNTPDFYYLLPLLILSIDKLVDNKKDNLYLFILMISILTNIEHIIAIFSLVIIYYLCRTRTKEKNNKFYKTTCFGVLLCSFILIPSILYANYTFVTQLSLSFIIVILFFALLVFLNNKKTIVLEGISLLLMVSIVLANHVIINDKDILSTNKEFIQNIDGIYSYRVESVSRNSTFNSASSFGVYNFKVRDLYKKLGNSTPMKFIGLTPVDYILFDVKYLVDDSDEYFDEIIYKISVSSKNKGLMFEVNEDVLNIDNKIDNPIEIRNELINKMSSIDNLFKEVKYEYLNKEDGHYKVSTTSDYVYVLKDGNITKVKLNDDKEMKLDNKDGSIIKVYEMDKEKFNEFTNTINNSVNILGITNNEILGYIDIKEDDKVIYTSIPYDDGWRVYIDGVEVNKEIVGDALLAFKINKGEHTIYMNYEVPFMYEGMIITNVTMIMYSILSLYEIITERKEDEDVIN